MALEKAEPTKPSTIHLFADFYFQTRDKQWIVNSKTGKIDCNQFSDWDTSAEARELKNTGRMELSIEPPEDGDH